MELDPFSSKESETPVVVACSLWRGSVEKPAQEMRDFPAGAA